MANSKEPLIKITRDGRFWSMGLVVNTIDDAFERVRRKAPNRNIFLEWPIEKTGNMLVTGGVCGSEEYLRKFI